MSDAQAQEPRGRPLVTDAAAASASPSLPAFLARPPGAQVYHGFPLVEDSRSDDWVLGMISDFGGADAHFGDGYVVAPDGSRCGLVWECCVEESFAVVLEATPDRRGVYFVALPQPLHGADNARPFLVAALSRLAPLWRAWAEGN